MTPSALTFFWTSTHVRDLVPMLREEWDKSLLNKSDRVPRLPVVLAGRPREVMLKIYADEAYKHMFSFSLVLYGAPA